MLILALLGCQAFASESNWKGEADVESNRFIIPSMGQLRWQWTVTSWTVPKNTKFDEKVCIDYLQKRLNVTFKSHYVQKVDVSGGTWIRGTADGLSLSAFMHPTKSHRAGVYCGRTEEVLPENPWNSGPGLWAIAFGNATSCNWNVPVYKIIE